MRWRQLGDELVAYNGQHGSTHLLSTAAGEVLKLLLEVDCTAVELGTRLFADSNTEADDGTKAMLDEETATLETLLAELVRLGLVEVRAT